MPAQAGAGGPGMFAEQQHHRPLGFIHAVEAGHGPQDHQDSNRPTQRAPKRPFASAAESAEKLFQRIADDIFQIGLLAAAPIP